MTNKKNKIFICATEQSGDNIGFNIITKLLKKDPQIVFDGVGGDKMSPLLSNKYFSIENFNSMGIFEIIFTLNKYIKMLKYLAVEIINNKYDLIITIDSPDFNYPLIKKLRKLNYNSKIIHIVAPTVWAWREYRAKKFSKVFDELLILFEFEKKYFDKYYLKTTFIGHPIFYINSNKNIQSKKNYIAFLPGSRLSELNSLLKYFNLAYLYLINNNIDLNIFIPTLPHIEDIVINYTKNWKINTIVTSDKIKIEKYYSKTKKALVCSGTASLEISKRNIPQLVIYKLNFFTEIIINLFIKIKYVNIINIIENKIIIPELVNSKLNTNNFISEFEKLIKDSKSNDLQIINANNVLKKIVSNESPYLIAANRIKTYL